MTTAELLIGAGGALAASALFLLGYLAGSVTGARRQIDAILDEEWERWERLHQK